MDYETLEDLRRVSWRKSVSQHKGSNLVVFGVGHSGTSILAEMIAKLGWNLGDNIDGYFEDVTIRAQNDSFIDSGFSEKIDGSYLSKLKEPWVIKDPRFVFTLSEWSRVFKDNLSEMPCLIYIKKNRDSLLKSFKKREEDGLSYGFGSFSASVDQAIVASLDAYNRWDGPKLTINYEDIVDAVSLFKSPNEAPLVSYCITNFNRSLVGEREYLPSLVQDLMQDAPQNCELVLTDWHSVDKPVREWLPKSWDKGLQIIDMDGKFSISQGKFVACERANGEYIFVLDADMRVPKGFTEKMISILDQEAEICFPYYYDEKRDGSLWPTEKEVKQFIIDNNSANRGQGNHMFKKTLWPFLRVGYWEVLDRTEWGLEDNVLYWRAQQVSGKVWRGWIKDFIHQWHPKEGSFYG